MTELPKDGESGAGAGGRRPRGTETGEFQVRKMERLGSLSTDIANEFNNLLVGVLGHVDLALPEVEPGSPLQHHLEEIERAAVAASKLAQEMLAYSGGSKLAVESFDLSGLVEEMWPLLEVAVPGGTPLRHNLGLNLPLVEAGASQVRQVVLQLLAHAAEAAPGTLEVSTGTVDCDRRFLVDVLGGQGMRTGRFVYVEVAAAGGETAADVRQPAAEPSDEVLGLAAVLRILRKHYGGLKIHSDPEGATSLTAFFPAFQRPATGEVPLTVGWHDGGTVLLIDANAIVRSTATETLEKIGFEVLAAADGEHGLELYREHRDEVVLVVLDAALARPASLEVFDQLLAAGGDARVLLATGYGEQGVLTRFAGRPVAGYLRKPFRLVNLKQEIRRALHGGDGQTQGS